MGVQEACVCMRVCVCERECECEMLINSLILGYHSKMAQQSDHSNLIK